MTTDVITDETTTVQDAFEEAAAEKLAEEAQTGEQTEEVTDSGLEAQGGILPSLGEQTEMEGAGFEKPAKTSRQLAEEFLEHFQADVEKAETALGNARRKLREAQDLRDDAEENLRREIRRENDAAGIAAAEDAAVEEYAPTCTGHPCPVYADGEGDLAGQKVCHDGDDVSAVMVAEVGVTECPRCPTAKGEDAVDQITGELDGGNVLVCYPGDALTDARDTEVGPHTQYVELIADYLSGGGSGTIEDYRVVAERELSDPEKEYGRREPHDVIWSGDYGEVLRVAALEQGS